MPRLRAPRVAAALATVTAAALVPLTVAPASAAPVAQAPTATTTTAATLPATTRTTVRWVKKDRARVVAKRDRSSRTIARPSDGTRLVVVDRAVNQLKVRLPSGRTGWIRKAVVTTTPLTDVAGTRYTTGRVKVTKKINGSSRTVATAALGTELKRTARTTGRDTNRVKVKLPGGKTGWISSSRLTTRDVWGQLANCESGGRPGINTGNGYYGMYQFTASTWRAVGGSGLPHRHGAAEQTKRAQILQARAGWGQWPHCTSKLGLR
ncbi:transglycosylase-like protein with SLT domain [Isoptericola jiangsuensis]|uniref:Transglycosylase-like protein with SLT domain n=1 Tax=Isoptericola jiangsuensis TaxID=548579 RepID=A0A2A9EUF1_9MICO|nr:transglycosylase family protein [Isoptericola jiangsuensis]PFG41902.1 transglycosylase-like protein with SLT domain [Isoptericola jiangsuensis]